MATVHHLNPHDVKVRHTSKGMVITVKVDEAGKDATYVIHLNWNGWVSYMLRALADVVSHKVNI